MEINKKILASVFMIGLLALSLGWGTYAWFFDKETSTGNVFTAGTIDLAVWDGSEYKDKFSGALVTLDNMLPSEWAYKTVWIMNIGTRDGDAWIHLDITDWGLGIPWYIDFDLKVADTVVIDPEDGITLGHIRSCWIPLGGLPVDQELKIELSFHLKGETPNGYNGDRCTFKIDFYLNQPGATPPKSNRILLENKDTSWNPVIGDGKWGIVEYDTSALTLTVWAHGLTPNAYHQICLNSQPAPSTDSKKVKIASALASGEYNDPPQTAPASEYNLYERGYWKTGPNLVADYSDGAEGIYNVAMFAQADGTGYLYDSGSVILPSGEYDAIKLIIKEAINAEPNTNYGTDWPPQLMECWIPLYFTIS